jgi:hypothetical protein
MTVHSKENNGTSVAVTAWANQINTGNYMPKGLLKSLSPMSRFGTTPKHNTHPSLAHI